MPRIRDHMVLYPRSTAVAVIAMIFLGFTELNVWFPFFPLILVIVYTTARYIDEFG